MIAITCAHAITRAHAHAPTCTRAGLNIDQIVRLSDLYSLTQTRVANNRSAFQVPAGRPPPSCGWQHTADTYLQHTADTDLHIGMELLC